MADIGGMLGAGGALAWSGRKLLGPLFDEVAKGWAERYSERRKRNLENILKAGAKKIRTDSSPSDEVSPRVAARVLEDGTWADAEVMAEYFGGILAASRSTNPDDDRGVSWVALVSQLSTYDVYLHFLIYDAFRSLYAGEDDIGDASKRSTLSLYLPGGALLTAMGLQVSNANFHHILSPAQTALLREGLLDMEHAFGSREFLETSYGIDAPDAGMVVTVSLAGIELFLWAHGHRDRVFSDIVDSELDFPRHADLQTCRGARRLADMRRERSERLQREQNEQNEQ